MTGLLVLKKEVEHAVHSWSYLWVLKGNVTGAQPTHETDNVRCASINSEYVELPLKLVVLDRT